MGCRQSHSKNWRSPRFHRPYSKCGPLFLYFLHILYFLYLITSLLPYFITSIFSIPIYPRKTSGTTIDPSAC